MNFNGLHDRLGSVLGCAFAESYIGRMLSENHVIVRTQGYSKHMSGGRYSDPINIKGYSNCGCAHTGYNNNIISNIPNALNELVNNPDPNQSFIENLPDVYNQLMGQSARL